MIRWHVIQKINIVNRLVFNILVLMIAGISCGNAEPHIITNFDQPFVFVYGEWQDRISIQEGKLPIHDVNGKGGGGCVVLRDLSAYQEYMPVLRLRVGANNQAKSIALLITDPTENVARWEFKLPASSDSLVTVLPANGGTLAEPDSVTKNTELDLTRAVTWQIVGDWSNSQVDVVIEQVVLIAAEDEPAYTPAREAHLAKLEAELRQAQEKLIAAKSAVKHLPSCPWIEKCYTVTPEILAISIRARDIIPGHIEPYEPQTGDEVIPQGNRADLMRNGQFVAKIIGPQLDTLVFEDQIKGDALLELLANHQDTWTISSTDDPDYANATAPIKVDRKSKPVNWQKGSWGPESFAMRHIVYLHLPKPLAEGATYNIDCSRINLRNTEYRFSFNPRNTWSEAVHNCQIGFRPDDPLKRGFVSVWLGTGGAAHFPAGQAFAIVNDVTGDEVFRGPLVMSRRAEENENMWVKEPRNWNYTDVLYADFSAITTSGTYRLYVDGVGCSYPFHIADDVWQKAFLVQMRGFYNQRSGIEIGPPYSEYIRPRDLHPEDGTRVFQSTHSVLDGGNEWELANHATDELVPEGWGGYHDAGDWNPRRMTHMRNNTDLLLELLQMNPEYFDKISWPLPQDYPVPSMLNEIMFEVDFFRRLQLPNGACRFGMETEGDPRDAEVSWKQTMDVYVYAPDPWSSFIYSSIAARLAGVLERYDAKLAGIYKDSAIRAMEWAEGEWAIIREQPNVKNRWEIPDDRNLAAIELYRVTGEKRWLDIFMQDTVLKDDIPELFSWGNHVQQHAAFAYTQLPDNLADASLKAKAKAATLTMAQRALDYAAGNAWGLTTSDKGRPLFLFFYSVPQAVDLVRAHYLTGDTKYLQGILQASLYPGGANPVNTTFTVGVGADWPHNPLKVDARLTGQSTPLGQTVYGPLDYLNWRENFQVWPMDQLLSGVNVPGPYEWPVPEAFYDIWIYVAQDEYTVDGFGQNAYIWGYLAARK